MAILKFWSGRIVALAIALGISASSLLAAPAKQVPAGLEDLGDQLLGDLLLPTEPKGAAKEGSKTAPPLLPGVDQLRDKLVPAPSYQQPEGSDLGEQRESPLVRISERMDRAKHLIASQDLSGQTREVQEAIVSDLDKLIEQLNQQCKNCNNPGQSQKPSQSQQTKASQPKPGSKPQQQSAQACPATAAQESQASAGGAVQSNPGELSDQELVKKLWGQLPQRMREQLLQSSADEFLPKYRAELEEYFRKLSEEERSDR